jgi:expansin (peptidoglycan-binding protein)
MKFQSLITFACLFTAASVVQADFDRNLWEEVPRDLHEHGTASSFSTEETTSNLDKRAWSYNNKIVTWYSGQDLQNPACYQNSSPRIKDSMKIAAVKDSKKCFWCLKIYLTKKHPKRSDLVLRSTTRTTTVKVIDYCPSCGQGKEKVNSSHVDLSTSAFKELGSMNAGELPITWQRRKCFKSKSWPRTPGKNY